MRFDTGWVFGVCTVRCMHGRKWVLVERGGVGFCDES